ELYKIFENEKFSDINYELLSSSKNMDALIENLKQTKYYKILLNHKNAENRLFYMEMSLDVLYFKELNKEMKKVLGDSKENTILEVLGKNSDLLNIQWIYRGLKSYKLLPEELLNYVLLTGYQFNYSDLKKLCYSKNIESLIEQIKKSKYGFLFQEGDFELLMERNVERYIYNLFRNIEKISTMNLNKSISYIHKLEYEMRDIFTIMEAVKYDFNPEELKKMLVRDLEGR
ncbi:MAG: V-type ATPase subunit, partial [Bacillota bacterium]|nr:V-type ATPase subunit [Bacillota bacterium]